MNKLVKIKSCTKGNKQKVEKEKEKGNKEYFMQYGRHHKDIHN